jgi:L-seryl-tRNA(Ser) seleniumtransferase
VTANPFRRLPAVHQVLDSAEGQALAKAFPREEVVGAVRQELDSLRELLRSGAMTDGADADGVAARVRKRLEQDLRPKLRRVINATGIVLHTNLGRAPMADAAARAAHDAARGYLNLELNLAQGKRSSRQNAVRDWLIRLTGAESATAVNNNAAATVIVLRAVAAGREVIVSRGQLIEIGGSFRIPDIMEVSGARLREVGTTNITRLSDYEKAVTPATGALMFVHSSNYRISGFTESVPLSALVALGRKHNLPVIDDVGSGALLDFNRFGFTGEPVVQESIRAGADLVLFSGDKLLGGPQAGLIVGRMDYIQRIEKDPLMRAFRLDKMALAALDATLRLYLDEERALREIPVLRMLANPPVPSRAERLAGQLRQADVSAVVVPDRAFVGGGSLPDQATDTWVIEVVVAGLSDEELARRLRTGEPAVLGRLHQGKLLLDPLTVFPEQEAELIEAVRRAKSPPP